MSGFLEDLVRGGGDVIRGGGDLLRGIRFRVEVYNHTGRPVEIRGPGGDDAVVEDGRRAIYNVPFGDKPTYRAYVPGTNELVASAQRLVDGNITIELRH